MLKLYSYYRSSAAFRVRIDLELKGLDWESSPINLILGDKKQQSLQQNKPQGLIPLLESNEQFFTQSQAIIDYLEELHPDNQLLPSGITERAQLRGKAYQVSMEIHPLNNLRVLKYLEDELGLD